MPASVRSPEAISPAAPVIACGAGGLRLLHVQREGKKPMTAAEWLRGFSLPPGSVLGAA